VVIFILPIPPLLVFSYYSVILVVLPTTKMLCLFHFPLQIFRLTVFWEVGGGWAGFLDSGALKSAVYLASLSLNCPTKSGSDNKDDTHRATRVMQSKHELQNAKCEIQSAEFIRGEFST